jgi:hypothetical protein
MYGLFLKYSYFTRNGHAVPTICVVAVHKTTERNAGHWSTSADARNQPAQIGEHLATNHAAQMRCIPESRQGRLGIQIAARVRQANLNAGSDRRRSSVAAPS